MKNKFINKKIEAQADEILSAQLRWNEYRDKCIEAMICPICGEELEVKVILAMFLECESCGYYKDSFTERINEEYEEDE